MLQLLLFRMLKVVTRLEVILLVVWMISLLSPAPQTQAQEFCGDLPSCLSDLKAEDSATRSSAVKALGRMGGAEAVSVLLEVLKKDSDLEVQATAVRTLGRIGDHAAVPVLTEALFDPGLQDETVRALMEIGGREAVDAFVKALDNEDTQIIALQGLAEIGDREAKPHLLSLYRNTTDDRIRGMASIAFQRIKARLGPTEEELGFPLFPTAKYLPNGNAEWIFTVKDSLESVTGYYRKQLNKEPLDFEKYRREHESHFGESAFLESRGGSLSDEPDAIFVVEEQVFEGQKFPSKLIFLTSRGRKTDILVYHAVGPDD